MWPSLILRLPSLFDPKTASSVMDLLLELCAEEKVTLLLVTHAEEIAVRCPQRFDCTGLIREVAS